MRALLDSELRDIGQRLLDGWTRRSRARSESPSSIGKWGSSVSSPTQQSFGTYVSEQRTMESMRVTMSEVYGADKVAAKRFHPMDAQKDGCIGSKEPAAAKPAAAAAVPAEPVAAAEPAKTVAPSLPASPRLKPSSTTVVVVGHTGRYPVNGVYRSLERTYFHMPVFFNSETDTYLFRSERNGSWGIGDRACGGLIAVIQSSALRVQDIRGVWKVASKDCFSGWMPAPDMRVVTRRQYGEHRCDSIDVESHYAEIVGRYVQTGKTLNGAPTYANAAARMHMWFDGRRWQLCDDSGGLAAMCHARSVELRRCATR